MSMERKKRKLEERKIFQYREQKTCKEQVAEGLYGEANKRLQKAIIDKSMGQRLLLFKS